jgi:phage gp29-like protein
MDTQKVGIPVPKENEAVLTPPAAPSPVGLSTTPVFRHFAALSTTGEVVDPAQDALDSATSPGESIAVAMDKLIAPLVSALRGAKP